MCRIAMARDKFKTLGLGRYDVKSGERQEDGVSKINVEGGNRGDEGSSIVRMHSEEVIKDHTSTA